jgi:alpha-L-fucosidase
MAEYGPEKAVDGNSETRWATDSGTKSAWLEVDLGKPAAIGRCLIEQAYPELKRVRKFAIEYWQDGKWQPCYRGENLGATLEAAFPPVTAQRVRLNISEATDGRRVATGRRPRHRRTFHPGREEHVAALPPRPHPPRP